LTNSEDYATLHAVIEILWRTVGKQGSWRRKQTSTCINRSTWPL